MCHWCNSSERTVFMEHGIYQHAFQVRVWHISWPGGIWVVGAHVCIPVRWQDEGRFGHQTQVVGQIVVLLIAIFQEVAMPQGIVSNIVQQLEITIAARPNKITIWRIWLSDSTSPLHAHQDVVSSMNRDAAGIRVMDGVANDYSSCDRPHTMIMDGIVATKLLTHVIQLYANKVCLGVTDHHLKVSIPT